MVTKGQRRLGRTIRKLENSVEFSAKENKAKELENKYRERLQQLSGCKEDSPIQSLRGYFIRKKNPQEPWTIKTGSFQ